MNVDDDHVLLMQIQKHVSLLERDASGVMHWQLSNLSATVDLQHRINPASHRTTFPSVQGSCSFLDKGCGGVLKRAITHAV